MVFDPHDCADYTDFLKEFGKQRKSKTLAPLLHLIPAGYLCTRRCTTGTKFIKMLEIIALHAYSCSRLNSLEQFLYDI